MPFFEPNDMNVLMNAVSKREWVLQAECVNRHIDAVLEQVLGIMDRVRILDRMKTKIASSNTPRDHEIEIHGFNGKRRMEHGRKTTRADVIGSNGFKYKLDAFFNEGLDYPIFRTSLRRMNDGNMPGWLVIVLSYFRNGVPKRLIPDDPEMPPLDDGPQALPASPVQMNPEDQDYDDDKSDHGGGCACRDCRNHYGWNRDY